MKKYQLIIKITITLLCIVSCTNYIEFDKKNYPTEIQLNAFIAKDSIIQVYADKCFMLFAPERRNAIDSVDIKIELYENGEFVEILQRSTTEIWSGWRINNVRVYDKYPYYQSTIKAKTGSVYLVKASHPEYVPAQASTSIPDLVTIDSGRMSFVEADDSIMNTVNFEISFTDPGNEENYYRIVTNIHLGLKMPTTHADYDSTKTQILHYINQGGYLSTSDPIIKPEETADDFMFGTPYNQYSIFSDKFINGKSHTFSYRNTTSAYSSYNMANLDTANGEFFIVNIELHHINKEAYLYLQSAEKQQFYDGMDFLIEPVQVFSNIENGVGIFTGYAVSAKEFRFGEYPSGSVEYIDPEYGYWWYKR